MSCSASTSVPRPRSTSPSTGPGPTWWGCSRCSALRGGDLCRRRPHQRRRVRRARAVPRAASCWPSPRRTASSRPSWWRRRPAASATSTTCSPGWCRSPKPPRSAPCYRVEEVAALAEWAHRRGMWLHLDGARLANAAGLLGVGLGAFGSARRGRRAVLRGHQERRHGGRGGGLLPSRRDLGLRYIRKQSMQLASKMRFIAAQFVALLTDDLWLSNATHANAMAQRLAEGVGAVDGVTPGLSGGGQRGVRRPAPGRDRGAAGRVPVLRLGRGTPASCGGWPRSTPPRRTWMPSSTWWPR